MPWGHVWGTLGARLGHFFWGGGGGGAVGGPVGPPFGAVVGHPGGVTVAHPIPNLIVTALAFVKTNSMVIQTIIGGSGLRVAPLVLVALDIGCPRINNMIS